MQIDWTNIDGSNGSDKEPRAMEVGLPIAAKWLASGTDDDDIHVGIGVDFGVRVRALSN